MVLKGFRVLKSFRGLCGLDGSEGCKRSQGSNVTNPHTYVLCGQTDNITRRRRCAEHDTCKIHKTNLTSKIIGG